MLANVVSKVLVVSDGAGKGQGFHATMWPAILKPCWFSHRVIYILSVALSGSYLEHLWVGWAGWVATPPAPKRSCTLQLLAGPALDDT